MGVSKPFLALITPVGDTGGGGGPPEPPLGIWGPTDPRPTHPIAGYPWPQPPGGGGPVDPGYSPPWAQAPGGGPGGPVDPGYSPPWARPGPPLGIWGPTDPRPSHPIYIPIQPPLDFWGPNDPRPTPPIYIPVQPQPPLGIWGPTDPRPNPPIYIPLPSPPGTMPPAEVVAKIKEVIEFWTGNLPENPNPKPEPV